MYFVCISLEMQKRNRRSIWKKLYDDQKVHTLCLSLFKRKKREEYFFF